MSSTRETIEDVIQNERKRRLQAVLEAEEAHRALEDLKLMLVAVIMSAGGKVTVRKETLCEAEVKTLRRFDYADRFETVWTVE